MTELRSTVMPALRYRNAPAAIDWLCQVFGFERHAVYANPDGSIAHAELTLNGGMSMLGSAKEDEHAQRYRSPDDLNGVMRTRSTPGPWPPGPPSCVRSRTPITAAASSP